MRHIDVEGAGLLEAQDSHHNPCGKQRRAMEVNGGSKVITGIRQIVKLKEFINRWQNVTLGSKEQDKVSTRQSHGGISPAISRRLRSSNAYCESDEDGCASPEPPHGVPKGYLAVYVGPELRRFIIPTSYLSDPLFKVLLEKVEEEFGFEQCGGLTIPCEIETFKYLLQCMENHQRDQAEHKDEDTAAEASPAIEE